MDVKDLFSGKPEPPEETNQKKVNLAVLDSFLADLCIHGIEKDFDIIRDNPVQCSTSMAEGVVSSAIITAVDYTKGKGSWKLISDICIAVKSTSKIINLFFNKEINDLNTIAIDSSDPTALALLKIIMREKYVIFPEYVSIKGSLTDKLNSADAALISGNAAFRLQKNNKSFIDLGDEWFDLTGLPFVYALWAIHEMVINAAVIEKIKTNVKNNLKYLDKTLKLLDQKNNDIYLDFSQLIKNSIIYDFGLEEKESINEFFRYAFFFGLIEHIPELHFI